MIIDDTVVDYYEKGQRDNKERGKLKNSIKDAVGEYIWKKTKRRPMVLPVILDVE
jgi:ribonuclease J